MDQLRQEGNSTRPVSSDTTENSVKTKEKIDSVLDECETTSMREKVKDIFGRAVEEAEAVISNVSLFSIMVSKKRMKEWVVCIGLLLEHNHDHRIMGVR